LVVCDSTFVVAVKGEKPARKGVKIAQGVFKSGLGPLVHPKAVGAGAQAVVVVDAVNEEGLVKAPKGLPGGQVHEASALDEEPHRAWPIGAAPLIEVVGAKDGGFGGHKVQSPNELVKAVIQELGILVHSEEPFVAFSYGALGAAV
jgi:hypothetical protein